MSILNSIKDEFWLDRWIFFAIGIAILIAGCVNPIIQAYSSTEILGNSREVYSFVGKLYFRFAYRGGFVTYDPEIGAYWRKVPPNEGHTDILLSELSTPRPSLRGLIRGCVIYACQRAELIRAGGVAGASRSQVISYQNVDNIGHSFVVFDFRGRTFAEDDSGQVVVVRDWTNRTADEARTVALEFFGKTHAGSALGVKNANFLGEY